MKKDISKLRPFNPGAAQKGEPVCYDHGRDTIKYLSGPDHTGRIAYQGPDNRIYVGPADEFRMAPLCWVDGKPVYKGDVLYSTGCFGGPHRIDEIRNGNGAWMVCSDPGEDGYLSIEGLTWTPPKVKREGWVNIYSAGGHERAPSALHKDKATADHEATEGRIACVRIEWEEPSAP